MIFLWKLVKYKTTSNFIKYQLISKTVNINHILMYHKRPDCKAGNCLQQLLIWKTENYIYQLINI